MTNAAHDQWQALVEEWTRARDEVWNASQPITADFGAIAHGRPNAQSPPDADLQRLDQLVAKERAVRERMDALIRETFGGG